MTRKPMSIRFDPEDHEQLRLLAFELRVPMNEIVRRAVHAVISNPEEQHFLLTKEES